LSRTSWILCFLTDLLMMDKEEEEEEEEEGNLGMLMKSRD
jgi:hypothetical protein